MFYENINMTGFTNQNGINNIKYKSFNLHNFKEILYINKLSDEQIFDIEVVGNVLPFKINNYVINELIDWDSVPNDPIFKLTFPQKDMLEPQHYKLMSNALLNNYSKEVIAELGKKIRMELNPQPSGQIDYNIPTLNGNKLQGIQHKYKETVLFFPRQGQTCHAYCTFCFRWPQFTNLNDLKFSSNEVDLLIDYLKEHSEVSDLLITGGDPMVMSGKIFSQYIDAILEADLPNLNTIRIGSKSLSYWPHRFISDYDSDLILKTFEKVVKSGRQLSFMAHINHYREMETDTFETAVKNILNTGANIRTQSPILRHINDAPEIWEKMWSQQVRLGIIPYYMFIPRDTGAQHYFRLSLIEAWHIFRKAYMNVGGNARTVRGPVMSCGPGKIQILGVAELEKEKVLTLRFIQARIPEWVDKPFFAAYNVNAFWNNDLKPAFGKEKFFYEKELNDLYKHKKLIRESEISSFS